MTIKKRLKDRSGFTLAETLLAVLILLLVSGIVANGIPVARNVYNNVIVGANAQVLLSTAVTALRNELGTARDVEVNGDAVTYFNTSLQAYSRISLGAGPEKIVVDPYVSPADRLTPLPGSRQRDLVSNAASNRNLYVTYGAVTYDPDSETEPDIITISGIEVKRDSGDNATLASLEALKIRLVPEPAPDI